MDLTEHKPGRKHVAADLIFDEQFKKHSGGWRDAARVPLRLKMGARGKCHQKYIYSGIFFSKYKRAKR
jgi:hypothetical protein